MRLCGASWKVPMRSKQRSPSWRSTGPRITGQVNWRVIHAPSTGACMGWVTTIITDLVGNAVPIQRHRLKEHTVDYVPLRRKSKNHSSHHSKQPAAKTNDTLTSNTTDLSLPTLVSTTTTNLTEALATLTEQLTANMNNKQQEAEMDKLLREINSPAKRRKTDPESGAVSSDSITSDESEPQLDPSAVAAYLETELLSLAHCDVCKAQPSSFDQVRTCFMCPSKFYCAGCLLSIPHLLQHSKLNNQLATNDTWTRSTKT